MRPLGFIFLPPKGGGNNRDKADAEKYARQTERKIFAAHSRRNAGIGKIGAAYYLCGKISISKVQKKSKKDDDLDLYDFEIETAPPKRSLCVDSIRMLYSGEIDEFVEKELLPDAAETMKALSEAEKTAVSLLLKAYIGFLSEEATVDEQSFPMGK